MNKFLFSLKIFIESSELDRVLLQSLKIHLVTHFIRAAWMILFARCSSNLGSLMVGITLRKTAVVPIAAAFRESRSSKVPGQIFAPSCANSNEAGEEGLRIRAWT